MNQRPLILITNDDGIQADGIQSLIGFMQPLGRVVVVAPDGARSGAACAITTRTPVQFTCLSQDQDVTLYTTSGTPSDCVKLAIEKLLDQKPTLLVSGINHGDNASINVHYSGTMGAVLEGCMKGIPSIGFSLCTHLPHPDFECYGEEIQRIARYVLQEGLPQDVCLNVNIPYDVEIQGVRTCRMARGRWKEEWVDTEQPNASLLTGEYINLEPDDQETDAWALNQGYIAITPIQVDMTHLDTYQKLQVLNR